MYIFTIPDSQAHCGLPSKIYTTEFHLDVNVKDGTIIFQGYQSRYSITPKEDNELQTVSIKYLEENAPNIAEGKQFQLYIHDSLYIATKDSSITYSRNLTLIRSTYRRVTKN